MTNSIKYIENQLKLSVDDLLIFKPYATVNWKNNSNDHIIWKYSSYIIYLLLFVKEDTDLYKVTSKTVVDQMSHGLRLLAWSIIPCLPEGILSKDKSVQHYKSLTITQTVDERFDRLSVLLTVLEKFLGTKHYALDMNSNIFLIYFSGIITIEYFFSNQFEDPHFNITSHIRQSEINYYSLYMNVSSTLSEEKSFFFHMYINGNSTTKPKLLKLIHQYLISNLFTIGGYERFIKIICNPSSTSVLQPHHSELISSIISTRGLSDEKYILMVNEIHSFILKNIDTTFLSVGIMSLNKLYAISSNKNSIKKLVDQIFLQNFYKLSNPEELLAGAIIMSNDEFCEWLRFTHTCFCGNLLQSMKSSILIPCLPILVRIYAIVPVESLQRKQVKGLILQILGNRSFEELSELMNCLLFNDVIIQMKQIHSRVAINCNASTSLYSVQILKEDETVTSVNVYETVMDVITNSNHNVLICNIFNAVLSALVSCIDSESNELKTNQNLDLLEEEDYNQLISTKFRKEYIAITCLESLIKVKGLHSQISENPTEMILFLNISILKRLKKSIQYGDYKQNEDIIMVILTICRELIPKIKDKTDLTLFESIIEDLLKSNAGSALKHQASSILNDLTDNEKPIIVSKYTETIGLCLETAPHMRVYGITNLIKLIESCDEETIANKHSILIMALEILKDKESFVFLRCVKLFVVLSSLFESDVLDALIVKYQDKKNDTDYRLTVGEVIMKIVEKMKMLAYNYKDILINCFIAGAKDTSDELRFSSVSNLGHMCNILTYQITNFFEELMILIENIIKNDTYLPARRSAVMILSHILSGVEKLTDFEEYLLPIYRALKSVEIVETDEVTLLHANIGLTNLNDKIKSFLFPKEILEKKIKVLGINDDIPGDSKRKNLITII